MNVQTAPLAASGQQIQNGLRYMSGFGNSFETESLPGALPIGRSAPVTEVHGPADRVSSAYRRYLNRLGIALGTC